MSNSRVEQAWNVIEAEVRGDVEETKLLAKRAIRIWNDARLAHNRESDQTSKDVRAHSRQDDN